MAYYEDKQELRDGRILLYKIVGSKKGTWQMRLNVRDHKGYITRTTKERSIAEAARVADDEFNRLSQRVREKADINDWGFAEHWEEWHARMSRSGNWKDERKTWHKGHFNRYFKPYFDTKKLNDMTLTAELYGNQYA